MSAQIRPKTAIATLCLLTATLLPVGHGGLGHANPLAHSIRPAAISEITRVSPLPQGLFAPLPTAFDLRDEGRAAPARPDDSCASCWADAATYIVESLLMPWEEMDLSDTHMQLAQTQGCQAGASVEQAINYLVSWNGPIAESDYVQLVQNGMKARERIHVQQVRYLPPRTGPLDNAAIKYSIYHYGPAYASVGWRGITNPTYNSYYWPDNGASHAVALVGWDDHFPKEQFTTLVEGLTPPGDGAFIAKNNNGGFYYLSYYDGTVGYNTVALFIAEPVSNHQRIYQHDPSGIRNYIAPHKIPGNSGDYVSAIYGANLFTALEAGSLSNVGFYVRPYVLSADEEGVFEVAIHLDPDSGPANSAGAALSFTTRIALSGYHAIALPTQIPLAAGQRFSVVLRGYRSSGSHNAIELPVERRAYTPSFAVLPGQSYISRDGLEWFDMTEVLDTDPETGELDYVYGNLGIKAYTKAPGTKTPILGYGLKPQMMQLRPQRPVYSFGTAPEVASTEPLPNAMVATENPLISARFYDEIKPGPGLGQITLSAADETRQVYAAVQGDTLSIYPSGPLGSNELGGQQWTVTLPADAVTDPYGKPMEQAYSWSFHVIGVN